MKMINGNYLLNVSWSQPENVSYSDCKIMLDCVSCLRPITPITQQCTSNIIFLFQDIPAGNYKVNSYISTTCGEIFSGSFEFGKKIGMLAANHCIMCTIICYSGIEGESKAVFNAVSQVFLTIPLALLVIAEYFI